MRGMKKIVSLFVALTMILSMSTFAFADTTTYKITIYNSIEGHTYEAYQILKGSLGEDDTLGDVQWGSGITDAGKAAFGDAVAKAESIEDEADAKDFAKEVARYLTATKATSTYNATEQLYEIENLESGYYLIKDQANSITGTDTYTEFILEVVKDIEIAPKSERPDFVKKIDDKNDSNTSEDEVVWNDSADYDIGDQVPFKLEGTVAADYDEYEEYYFVFHDVEEATLTFDPTSVKVYVDDVQITTGYEVLTATEDGCTFEVVFEDLKAIDSVHAGSKITVLYESELNENAILGNYGNVNKAKLEFSNNPTQESGGTPETGETEWDYVIVFTYKVVVNKYGEEVKAGNELAGAEFTLYKKLADGTEKAIAAAKFNEGKSFEFKGLDDGDYVLKETDAPAGYNKIDDIEFTITANHTILWEGEERTTLLYELDGGNLATGDVATGQIVADVVNLQGVTLPGTGGMGTVLFYAAGGLLVAFAAVALVSKKRMSKDV